MLMLPTPVGTTYIPGSAQIDGADFDDLKRRDPFGYGGPVTVARKLGPGATLTARYRVRIDPVLPDATLLVARGAVSSMEIGEFDLPEAKILVSSSPCFGEEQTRFDVCYFGGAHAERALAEEEIKPGQILRLRLQGCNVGTAYAREVRAKFELPAGLMYTPGSLCVDGQAFPDPDGALSVDLAEIEPTGSRVVEFLAAVTSPALNGYLLPIVATLQWAESSRVFTRSLNVVSKPRFSPTRTRLLRESSSICEPNETVEYTITVLNDGTIAAEGVLLTLRADHRLERLEAYEGAQRLEIKDGKIILGLCRPHVLRTVCISARVSSPLADGTEICLDATAAAADCVPYEFAPQVTLVRSRPRFVSTSSFLRLQLNEAIRPDHVCTVVARIRNEGNDRAADVCIAMRHSPELRLETVEGATRDGAQIILGDMDPGEFREVTIHFRLIHSVPQAFAMEVHASIVGRSLAPVVLDPVTIETYAEANFLEAASLVSAPRDVVDAGGELCYTLSLRNTGDGMAQRLQISVEQPNATTYVPRSTSVNGRTLLDHNGASLLWSEQGLTLNDIAPDVEVTVSWLSIVNMPLPVDTFIHAKATIAYDTSHGYDIVAKPVAVHSAPLFSLAASDLPFSITGTPAQRMRRSLPVPPALPRNIVSGTFVDRPEAVVALEARSALRLVTEFSQERLERTLQFLNEVSGGALLTHLFALRAFFPGAADASPRLDVLLEGERAGLRRIVDGLYVKLRSAELQLVNEDLEDGPFRETTLHLLGGLTDEQAVGMSSQRSGILRIVGMFDPSQASWLAAQLDEAPLGGVEPWYALAHLLGERVEYDDFQSDCMGAYRTALIEQLGSFLAQPVGIFHSALLSGEFAKLDEALRELLASFKVPVG